MKLSDFLKPIESAALGPGQMLVASGSRIYGWDLAKDGGDCCVVAEVQPDGSLKIIEVTHSQSMNSRT